MPTDSKVNRINALTSADTASYTPDFGTSAASQIMVLSSDSPPPARPVASQATPAMRQYLDAKRQYRDAIVFFRMGDFYEMFYEDALVAARALDLTLTSRSRDADGAAIPMCGVPHHAVDAYLARLVTKGFRVAICDQVEDPRKAKGLVKREVVRVVSPGDVASSSGMLWGSGSVTVR